MVINRLRLAFIVLSSCASGAIPHSANAQADSAVLARNLPARVRYSPLGPGWHEGRLVGMSVSNAGECLAFGPAAPSQLVGVSLDGVDSLEVFVPMTRPDSGGASRVTSGAQGKWLGVPRFRRDSLAAGCVRPAGRESR